MNKKRKTLSQKLILEALTCLIFSTIILMQMFHSGNMEHYITRRASKSFCNDTLTLSFDELLVKDKSVSFHQRNF